MVFSRISTRYQAFQSSCLGGDENIDKITLWLPSAISMLLSQCVDLQEQSRIILRPELKEPCLVDQFNE